jgi:DNA-binding beta-propeller fold protein YncE
MVTLGSGDFSYNVEVNWETVPDDYGDGWREVPAVYADDDDNVYLFTRGDHPMMVFDSSGNFVKSWGEGVFTRGHGISKGPNNTLYLTDDGDHTVRQCTLDGEVLMTIGVPGTPAPLFSGDPFNRCTHTATDPKTGDIYVSDGYGNSRIHKYSSDGNLLFSWGEPGNLPGQFSIAHNICTDTAGLVYLADRENHRIQVFDDKGKFLDQWGSVHRPSALYIDNDAGLLYVGEIGWGMNVNRNVPNIGPRVSIINLKGEVQAQLGTSYGLEAGQFISPHGICLDSHKNIYVGEVAFTNMTNAGEPVDSSIRAFQRLTKA